MLNLSLNFSLKKHLNASLVDSLVDSLVENRFRQVIYCVILHGTKIPLLAIRKTAVI